MQNKTAQPADHELLSLLDLSKLIGNQKHPHCSSLWRYCRKGKVGRNGSRVYLRHVRIPRELIFRDSREKGLHFQKKYITSFNYALYRRPLSSVCEYCPMGWVDGLRGRW